MRRNASLTIAIIAISVLFPLSRGRAEAEQRHEEGIHASCRQMKASGHEAQIHGIPGHYFAIRSALANDSLDGVSAEATALAEALGSSCSMKCAAQQRTDGGGSCSHGLSAEMSAISRELAKKTDLESARAEFGKLSEKFVGYQKKHLAGTEQATVFVCDMAKKVWLQEDDVPGNPYFGPAMARCARKVQ